MNRFLCPLVALTAPLLLAACGNSNDSSDSKPQLSVTDLSAGVYAVSTGDSSSPTAGKYYAAADGSRLLVLNDTEDKAVTIYRREGSNGSWQAIPAVTENTSVQLLNNNVVVSSTVDVSTLAGSYAARLTSGAAALFSINAAGDLVAGSSACKLSGKASAGTLPNTAKLSLSASSCGDLPATSTGVLIVDSDYAPARFRLLTDKGSASVDLWAYSE
jgi:hypothetical protein